MKTKEFDFVGSLVVCESCRNEFELYDNAVWLCENCHANCVKCKEEGK